MTAEIGYFSDNSKNIHFWDPLTADGSTPAVKIAGINFTIVHKIVGTNIAVIDEGSLNGTDWFPLESHSHAGSGIDAHVFSNSPVLYVRCTVSNVSNGETFHASIMSDQ